MLSEEQVQLSFIFFFKYVIQLLFLPVFGAAVLGSSTAASSSCWDVSQGVGNSPRKGYKGDEGTGASL